MQFASPSIDVPYLASHGQLRLTNGMPPMQFEQQPSFGGLGIMGPQLQPGPLYYQQSMVSLSSVRGSGGRGRSGADGADQKGMYGRSGYQA